MARRPGRAHPKGRRSSRSGRSGGSADSGGRVVFGVGPVRELLEAGAGAVARVYLADPDHALAALAGDVGVVVEVCARAQLDEMTARAVGPGAVHQGVVATAARFCYREVDDALAATGDEPALLVALDQVQDPHNLGAVIRSAYLLGAHGVIVPQDRTASVTPTVTKASAGATELIPVIQAGNLARSLEQLKERGLWVAAVCADREAEPLWQLDCARPLCLVLGSEGKGVRRLTRKVADLAVGIPMMRSGIGSFNVSVAAAIALAEIARKRQLAGSDPD